MARGSSSAPESECWPTSRAFSSTLIFSLLSGASGCGVVLVDELRKTQRACHAGGTAANDGYVRFHLRTLIVKDQVVVVTGGAEGIGRALCRRFAREGARIVVVVDIDGEGAGRVASEIGGWPIRADVSREAEIVAAVHDVTEKYGAIDLFVRMRGSSSKAAWRRRTTGGRPFGASASAKLQTNRLNGFAAPTPDASTGASTTQSSLSAPRCCFLASLFCWSRSSAANLCLTWTKARSGSALPCRTQFPTKRRQSLVLRSAICCCSIRWSPTSVPNLAVQTTAPMPLDSLTMNSTSA